MIQLCLDSESDRTVAFNLRKLSPLPRILGDISLQYIDVILVAGYAMVAKHV